MKEKLWLIGFTLNGFGIGFSVVNCSYLSLGIIFIGTVFMMIGYNLK